MKKILVKIFLYCLRFLARIQLSKNRVPIIGITGTAGKTSTKNAVQVILESKYKLKTSKKANSQTGIPLDILGLHMRTYSLLDWLRVSICAEWNVLTKWERYEAYLVEMGIDGPDFPDNMEFLLSIVQPTTGILLNVSPNHSERFDKYASEKDPEKRFEEIRQLILKEKARIITSLPKNGNAVLFGDDESIRAYATKTKAKPLFFGQNSSNHLDVRCIKVNQSLSGTVFHFQSDTKPEDVVTVNLKNYLLPDHFANTFGAALCVGLSEGISLQQGAKLLEEQYVLPAGRSTLVPGIKGSLILDSSYNATTQTVNDMLDLVTKVKPARRLALLGDMREMGEETNYAFTQVATVITKTLDKVYLVGPLTKQHLVPLLDKANFPYKHFDNTYIAADYISKELKTADLLLVKASQNTLLFEIAVEKLMRRPDKANDVLCRRGEYWDKEREKLKLKG